MVSFSFQPPAPEPVKEVVKGPVPAEHKVLQDIFDTLVQNCHARANNAVSIVTIKFLNFRTPENFVAIYLKFKQRGQILAYFVKKMQME